MGARYYVWAGQAATTEFPAPTGFSWSRVPRDEAVFGGPGTYQSRNHLNRVIAAESGVVAVGAAAKGAAVWVGVAEN
jgi:hypothetical protein